jgi:hypothetical protein
VIKFLTANKRNFRGYKVSPLKNSCDLLFQQLTSLRRLYVLSIVLFQLLVELWTNTLFSISAPMNAQVHIIKNLEATLAAFYLDI